MKKVSLLFTFLTLLAFSAIAGNSNFVTKVLPEKKLKINTKTSHNLHAISAVAYFWGFDGDCMQLYRIEESSTIDNNGMAHDSLLVTEMNSGNSAGLTTRICPPPGDSYC